MRNSVRWLVAGWMACVGMAMSAVGAEARILNGIAAVVNNEVITVEQVDAYAEPALRQAVRQYLGRPKDWEKKELELRIEARERLIDRLLILDEFKKKGYNLPESVIDEFVKSEIREKYRDRLTLTKELQSRNQTEEDFRKTLREDVIVAQMRVKNIRSQITISPKKIEAYYTTNQARFQVPDQVKLRMILLDQRKRADGEARKIADSIVSKVRGGGNFAELANSFSDDATRNRGGDRGWIENTDAFLRKELRSVAFALEKGKVSEPILIENTLFILMVEDRKSAGTKNLNEVRNEIESTLRNQEFARLESTWINRLRSKAYIARF